MLIMVYGDDAERVSEKVSELRARFSEKFDPTGLNMAEFPAPGVDRVAFADVLQAIQSAPFLGEKRMVIVRGLLADLRKADHAAWIDGLRRIPSSSIVVLVEQLDTKTLEKHAVFSALKDVAEFHAYAQERRTGAALIRWITERVALHGSSIDPHTAGQLAARIPEDVWRLTNEIDKLAAYAQGAVTMPMVDLLIARDPASNMFALVDAVAGRDTKTALRLLAEERAAGSADLYILAMLARQLRILLQVKSILTEQPKGEKSLVARALALHPFVAQKATAQAAKYTFSALSLAHALLTRLDRDAKRGRIDPSVAVDRVVGELLLI